MAVIKGVDNSNLLLSKSYEKVSGGDVVYHCLVVMDIVQIYELAVGCSAEGSPVLRKDVCDIAARQHSVGDKQLCCWVCCVC